MGKRIFLMLAAVCVLLTSCGHNQKDEQKTSIRAVEWAVNAEKLGAGKYCLPAWTVTEPKRGMIWS